MSVVYRKGADLIVQSFNGTQIGLFDVNKNELSGGGYSRQTFPGFVFVNEDANYFYYVNSNTILFPVATSNWVDVYYIGLFSDGQLALLVSLPNPATIRAGQQLIFFAGMIEIRIPKQMA
ncbi:TPA: hypothetical protein [Aquificae Conch Spring virus]|nr:TPA: hypothetical protein [Aquificae Conch Spring virus]